MKLSSKFILLFLFLLPLSPSSKAEPEIRIGYVDTMTGDGAHLGQSSKQGFELAINEINQTGGLLGRKIRLITLDDQGKPEETAIATTKLIQENHVHVLLASVFSTRAMAAAPIAQEYGIPTIASSATHPKLTELGNTVFRSGYADPFQGIAMAHFAHRILKSKKAVLISDIKSDHSVGLTRAFRKIFESLGGTVINMVSYSGNDNDYRSLLTNIKSKSPDIIYVPGYYGDVGLIARQARELGIQSTFLGSGAWDSPTLLSIAGNSIDKSYFTAQFFPESKSRNRHPFSENFKKTYGRNPDGHAATAYDAIQVLKDAVTRAGSLEAKKLCNALTQTKNVKGVSGAITLNSQRNAVRPSMIVEANHGQFKLFGIMSPDFTFEPSK